MLAEVLAQECHKCAARHVCTNQVSQYTDMRWLPHASFRPAAGQFVPVMGGWCRGFGRVEGGSGWGKAGG